MTPYGDIDTTKPLWLPVPMLTYHQHSPLAFTWGQFWGQYWRYQSLKCVSKLHIWNSSRISYPYELNSLPCLSWVLTSLSNTFSLFFGLSRCFIFFLNLRAASCTCCGLNTMVDRSLTWTPMSAAWGAFVFFLGCASSSAASKYLFSLGFF